MGLQELVLLLLFILPLCSAQNTYYVLPTPDTSCPTEPEGCCVLSECVERLDQYFASDTTLVFLPGSHILNTSLCVEGVSNLTLTGDSSFLPTVTSRITCIGNPIARFLFNETLGLNINALAFDSCGSGVFPGVSLMSVSDSQITNSEFQNCSSNVTSISGLGGALLVQFCDGNIVISDCIFENNSAFVGGGVCTNNSEVSFIRNHFANNTASIGGGLFIQQSTVTLMENCFISNIASISGGGVTILNGSASVWGEMVFMDNTAERGLGGGLFVQSSDVIFFSGDTNFEMNSALLLGGAILIYDSAVQFTGGVTLESNSANYGAAIGIIQSFLIAERTACFQNNRAVYGAGIYSREANLTFNGDTMFCNNMANFGGAIYASSSNLNIEGSGNFTQNSAMDGGGLLLTDGSTIYLFPSTRLYFIDNHAQETGGAIIVEESTPLAYCSDASLTIVVSSDCFFQLQNQTVLSPSDVSTVITFENNTATLGGSDLYGGTVDSCRLQNILCNGSGFACSGEIFDRVTSSGTQPLGISSDPLRVCLCIDNIPRCDDFLIPMEAYPGQSLQISATTFGQRNGSTAGVIRAELLLNTIQFQDLENIQRTNSTCTNLQYTVLTPGIYTEEVITLFAEGPCQREGRSLVFQVSILPCPPGFQQSELACVCDERLNDLIDTCNIDTRTILRPRGAEFWVGYDSNSQELILNPQCPFDYCSSNRLFVEVNDSDTQCNYNRSGVLCGGCSGTTSLVLGTSRCMRCSSSNVALILAFAVAGIAIVVLLFALKLTVAVGTVNGLIFYANLVQVNSSIFYPPGTTNILTVFIAWINLDLGIETCFYNGMDAYAKTWLQFVFPIYVWVLVGLIILISRFSQKMTNLLGSNPIAVLATLFLLSYAKVLRTIIAALSVTNLRYPDNLNVAVWSIDGNIEYLTGKHIPLFLISLLALLILFLPYTLFLFLAQWMQILQGKLEWRVFSWLSKPSVRALLDAYHAPYVNKHRYWTGLLLLIRCVLFLIFATAGDSSANLLAITSVITGLISFALLTGGIYKSWYLGALETSLLLNLVILTAATYHVKVSGGNQAAVVFFLLSIIFITFLGIIVFHIFLQLKKPVAGMWKRYIVKPNYADVTQNTPSGVSSESTKVNEEKLQSTRSEAVTTTYVELREPMLDEF